MTLTTLVFASLATWRVTNLLVNERGPFDIFSRFRHLVGVRYDTLSHPMGLNPVAQMLTCFLCTSIWVALAIDLLLELYLRSYGFIILDSLAISGAAIIIDRLSRVSRENGH